MSRNRVEIGSNVVRLVLAMAVAWTAVGCQRAELEEESYEPLVTFDTAAARVITDTDTIELTIELADTDARKAYGMMERSELPERHGMLFTYDEAQSGDRPFWMYRTLLPLDIAFLDEAGQVVAILSMEPCPSPNPQVCRRYAPGVPYSAALEVGQGLLDRWGVDIGDRVALVPAPPE